MTGQPEHVLVIGAGLGGVRTAEQLRAAGYQGRISLVGAEPHVPYDRPPLSKQILTGEWEPGRAILRTLDQLEDLGVRAHLGLAAVALRVGAAGAGVSEVELSDGATLYGDAVVLATGLVARRLPGQPAHVHTLRTLEDSLALRDALGRIGSLLIVGGGFIGAEVASAARGRGVAVTVLEAQPAPALETLGPTVGALAARLFADAGVDLRLAAEPAEFVEAGDRVAVRLADGQVVGADAALVGIGGTPRLDWLAGGPAPAPDHAGGLRCDRSGRVHGWERVWAVGDVSVWDTPDGGTPRRHEHWAGAGDQAAAVARDILGAPPPPTAVPYLWSDQFGLKLQLVGHARGADTVLPLHGTGFDGGPVRGTVAAYLADDRLVGVVGFGAPRLVARYRALVPDGTARAAVLARAAEL